LAATHLGFDSRGSNPWPTRCERVEFRWPACL